MFGIFLPLLIVLLLIASFMRGNFALTLIYLVVGALAAGLWWGRKALTQVETKRRFSGHAFLGEQVKIQLDVQNKGWLPVPWLELHETFPVALVGPNNFQTVTNLGSHAGAQFEYVVQARKRGYYPIGPLSISTGDILGLSNSLQASTQAEALVVYPKIIPFTSMDIPSQSPQGTLRHSVPLFEDPTRVFGKRGYTSGDSLRRIDWKSSASSGRLQVKVFEPSIALETFVVLNLNAEDYYYRTRIDSTELAIVIAASVSNWIVGQKQLVGMTVNGHDPLAADGSPQSIPPRKGKRHMMRLLETLARVEITENSALALLLQHQRYQLSWGTTLIVITGTASDELLDELYQARRSGQNAIVILAGGNMFEAEARRRAKAFGIPVYSIATERDLNIWTREVETRMNSGSTSNVLGNVKVFRFLGYLLVFLMMACVVMTVGMLIQNVLPSWHSGIIAGILSFIVIDRLYTYRQLRSLTPLSSEWAIAIGGQWLLILLLMRFLLSYADGLDSLRADLLLFARGYIAELFTLEYVVSFLLALLVWYLSGRFLDLLEEIGLDPVLALNEGPAPIGVAIPAHQRLVGLIFSLGIGLVILTALARVDMQTTFSDVEGPPQGGIQSFVRRRSRRLALFRFRVGAAEPQPVDVAADPLEPAAHPGFFPESDPAMGDIQPALPLDSGRDRQPAARR